MSVASPPAASPGAKSWNRVTKVQEAPRAAHGCPLPPDYSVFGAATMTASSRSTSADHQHPPFIVREASGRINTQRPTSPAASATSASPVDSMSTPKPARHHRDRMAAAASASASLAPGSRSISAFSNSSSAVAVAAAAAQRSSSALSSASAGGADGGRSWSVQYRSASGGGGGGASKEGLPQHRGKGAAAANRSASVGSTATTSDGAVSAAELAWEKEKARMLKLSSEQLVRKSLQMHFDVLRLRRRRAADASHVYRLRKCREFVQACADCVQDATLRIALLATPDTTLFDDDANSSPLSKILHATRQQDASPLVGAAAAALARRDQHSAAEASGKKRQQQLRASSASADPSFFRSTDPELDSGPHSEPDLSRNLSLMLDALACAETSMQQLLEIGERERSRADANAQQIVHLDEALRSLQAGRVELISMHASQTEQYELKLSDLRIQIADQAQAHVEATAELRAENNSRHFRIADLERLVESLQLGLDNEMATARQLRAEKEAAAAGYAAEARMVREAMDAQTRELRHTEAQLQAAREGFTSMFTKSSSLALLLETEAGARLRLALEQSEVASALQGECRARCFRLLAAKSRERRVSVAVETEDTDANKLNAIMLQSQQVIDAVHEQIFELGAELESRKAQYEKDMRAASFKYARNMLFALERAGRVRIDAAAKDAGNQVLQNVLFAPPDLPLQIASSAQHRREEEEQMIFEYEAQEEEIFSFGEFSMSSSPSRLAAQQSPPEQNAALEMQRRSKKAWTQKQLLEQEQQSQYEQHATAANGEECLVFVSGDDEEVLVTENWHNVLTEAWSRQAPPVERRKRKWASKQVQEQEREAEAADAEAVVASSSAAQQQSHTKPAVEREAAVQEKQEQQQQQQQQAERSGNKGETTSLSIPAADHEGEAAMLGDPADAAAATAPPSAPGSPKSLSQNDGVGRSVASDAEAIIISSAANNGNNNNNNHNKVAVAHRINLDELADGSLVSDEMLERGEVRAAVIVVASPALQQPPAASPSDDSATSTTVTIADRVRRHVAHHDPGKAGESTERLLQKYAGKERKLLDAMVRMYGPESPPPQPQPQTAAVADVAHVTDFSSPQVTSRAAADAATASESAAASSAAAAAAEEENVQLRQRVKVTEKQAKALQSKLLTALCCGAVWEKEAKERQNLYLTEYYGILGLLRNSMTVAQQMAQQSKKRLEAQKLKAQQRAEAAASQEQQQQQPGGGDGLNDGVADGRSESGESRSDSAPIADAASSAAAAATTSTQAQPTPSKRAVTFADEMERVKPADTTVGTSSSSVVSALKGAKSTASSQPREQQQQAQQQQPQEEQAQYQEQQQEQEQQEEHHLVESSHGGSVIPTIAVAAPDEAKPTLDSPRRASAEPPQIATPQASMLAPPPAPLPRNQRATEQPLSQLSSVAAPPPPLGHSTPPRMPRVNLDAVTTSTSAANTTAAALGSSPSRSSPVAVQRSPRHSPTRFNDDILELLESARKSFQRADEEAKQLLVYLEPTPMPQLPAPRRPPFQ